MLNGCETTLKFDDFASDLLAIDNSIGQGDPLSIALYQFYNANILDIPQSKTESAIAYIDDALLLAIASNFMEAHRQLAQMVTREGRVANWSKTHNSPLEYNKLALIDFTHQNNTKPWPTLTLPHGTIDPSMNTQYLGVILNQHLKWTQQLAHITEKGSKWAAQIKRATRPTWGITLKYTCKLYISVALPRILYMIDVWCTPIHRGQTGTKRKGSVSAVKKLITAQRAGTITITGALQTSPTNALDACAYTILAELLVEKQCHKAAVCLATLPPEHPLHKLVKASMNKRSKRYKAPLNDIMQIFHLDPKMMEKISVAVRNPLELDTHKTPLRISIPNPNKKPKPQATTLKQPL